MLTLLRMSSSSTTHGKSLVRLFCYEHTRFRKKPGNANRCLKQASNPFDFNAWYYCHAIAVFIAINNLSFLFRDNVEWSEEQSKEAEATIKKNGDITFSELQLEELEAKQATNWDSFYGVHQNKFFKDRHWLFTEFPELAPKADNADERKIFEIGSGVGNSELLTVVVAQPSFNLFSLFSRLPDPQIQQRAESTHLCI